MFATYQKKTLIWVVSAVTTLSAPLFVFAVVPTSFSIFLGVALAGLIPVGLVWMATRRIRRFWLRAMPRAITIAFVFGWAILPAPELHGALPLPVPYALFAIYQESRWDALPTVMVNIIITSFVLWSIAVGMWLAARWFRGGNRVV
jgi:hypothetical protein